MWTILAWICAAAISLLSLKYFPIPYLWIFLAGATALFVTAAMDRPRRALWFNVACLSIGLAVFEYYIWTTGERGFAARRVSGGNYSNSQIPSEFLGWALQPGKVVTQSLSFEGELLYDATYSIGPDGLRISSPTDDHERSRECALFFGGSFMFGQGLADHEALPFRVHEKTAGRYRTYNFGLNGYGAHQMLSALQHGLVQDAVQCDRGEVRHIFYQAITDHVRRAAGRVWWATRGPRYVLTGDGGVRHEGSFEDGEDYTEGRSFIEVLGTQIIKSMIYQKVVEGNYVRKFSDDVTNLYLEVIDEAQRVALAHYPAADFHVLLWDEDTADNQAIREGLRQKDITVHLMSDILPNYRPDDLNQQYRIHVRDPHPNALANELMAEYIVREILGEPEAEPEVGAVGPARQSTTAARGAMPVARE